MFDAHIEKTWRYMASVSIVLGEAYETQVFTNKERKLLKADLDFARSLRDRCHDPEYSRRYIKEIGL